MSSFRFSIAHSKLFRFTALLSSAFAPSTRSCSTTPSMPVSLAHIKAVLPKVSVTSICLLSTCCSSSITTSVCAREIAIMRQVIRFMPRELRSTLTATSACTSSMREWRHAACKARSFSSAVMHSKLPPKRASFFNLRISSSLSRVFLSRSFLAAAASAAVCTSEMLCCSTFVPCCSILVPCCSIVVSCCTSCSTRSIFSFSPAASTAAFLSRSSTCSAAAAAATVRLAAAAAL
mmetsp:Transcript_65666/g.96183  ORF Transcript_65666/g.96183 Transcript_65666/m.96183 type:complete len:234 (-) Transcript_65666:251-952(-)